MTYVDCSIILRLLAGRPGDDLLRQRLARTIHAPALPDAEVSSVVRGLAITGSPNRISPARAGEMLSDYAGLRIVRHPMQPLQVRVFELRHNLTAYDAMYVALAEILGLPLLTDDGKFGNAPAPPCRDSSLPRMTALCGPGHLLVTRVMELAAVPLSLARRLRCRPTWAWSVGEARRRHVGTMRDDVAAAPYTKERSWINPATAWPSQPAVSRSRLRIRSDDSRRGDHLHHRGASRGPGQLVNQSDRCAGCSARSTVADRSAWAASRSVDRPPHQAEQRRHRPAPSSGGGQPRPQPYGRHRAHRRVPNFAIFPAILREAIQRTSDAARAQH